MGSLKKDQTKTTTFEYLQEVILGISEVFLGISMCKTFYVRNIFWLYNHSPGYFNDICR